LSQTLAKRIQELQEELDNMQKHKKIMENELSFSKDISDTLRQEVQDLCGERERVLQVRYIA
jgi:chromosome segregation ATPase